MGEMKHTPGPWATEYMESPRGGYAQQIFDANLVLVATAAWYPVKVGESTTATNREANARLIAAAPELLEALEWYVRNDDTNVGQEGNEFYEEGLNRGLAAIAKATGEPT